MGVVKQARQGAGGGGFHSYDSADQCGRVPSQHSNSAFIQDEGKGTNEKRDQTSQSEQSIHSGQVRTFVCPENV